MTLFPSEKRQAYLVDTEQSAWELASIQLAGWTSLPIVATSILVLQKNSFWGAVLTILVGNALLWFIRLGMVAMSRENRQSSLDVTYAYLGRVGGYFISVLFLISTLAWFITQTTAASSALTTLVTIKENPSIDQFAQMSVFLGLVCSILCMDGVVMLKKLSVFSFPILLVTFLVILFLLPPSQVMDTTQVASLSGLSLVLATNLGVTSDLPTFFRHSKSWGEAVKGLLIVQVLSLILALCSLLFGSVLLGHLEINKALLLAPEHMFLRSALVVFIFLSVICANVANVYSASVGWELVAPKSLIGRKEYLILGLGLTIVFILVSDIASLDSVLEASDGGLVNLCMCLIVGYVWSKRSKKPPGSYEKTTYFVAWLVATIVNSFQITGVFWKNSSQFGVALSIIVALICVLLSGKKLFSI